MNQTIQSQTLGIEELLGPLNEAEKKYAPKVVFVAGDTSIVAAAPRVAIVGSRKASHHGIMRARKLAALLVSKGVTVVSGLAEGIDTAAHSACLEKGGRTIAVIGTSLDGRYPNENAALQERIMREHLCVSQFAAGAVTRPQNFPIRNRTMALIADVTVIIEAADKSGSLHQGWEALRLNRGLFITKAMANDPALKWPKEMQGYGASVLSDENVAELIENLPLRSTVSAFPDVPF